MRELGCDESQIILSTQHMPGSMTSSAAATKAIALYVIPIHNETCILVHVKHHARKAQACSPWSARARLSFWWSRSRCRVPLEPYSQNSSLGLLPTPAASTHCQACYATGCRLFTDCQLHCITTYDVSRCYKQHHSCYLPQGVGLK